MISAVIPGFLFSSGEGRRVGQSGDRSSAFESSVLASPVLIVEDEAMIAWMMESLLEDMGFTATHIAATGEEAMALAERLQPRLIISDINLGSDGMDGIDAAAAVHKQINPSVLFITAYASSEARERIKRDVPGASLLQKPIDAGELKQAIAHAIARFDVN